MSLTQEAELPGRPTVPDRYFDHIDTDSEDLVGRRFQGWVVDELHPFLNGLSCMDDVQAIHISCDVPS